jgi:hypothetical protein
MKTPRQPALPGSPRIHGHIAGQGLSGGGIALALTGFGILIYQTLALFITTEWKSVSMQSLYDSLNLNVRPNASLFQSIAHEIRDVPLGLAFIAVGMIVGILGKALVGRAQHSYQARSMARFDATARRRQSF